MNDSPISSTIEPDSSSAVFQDTPCRRCGYNLRGLNAEGVCPECGTPVRNSISGDLLRFADPAWVEKLGRGIRYILWAEVVLMLASVLDLVTPGLDPRLLDLFQFLTGAIGLYGACLLTSPDPSGIGEDRYGRSRVFIRLALLVGILDSLLTISTSEIVLLSSVRTGLGVASVLASLIGVGGEIMQLTYLKWLAERLPVAEYEQKARSLRWQYGGCLLIVVVLTGASALIPEVRSVVGAAVATALNCVMGLGILLTIVFSLIYLRLLYRMGKALDMQAALARAAWAPAAPAESPTLP